MALIHIRICLHAGIVITVDNYNTGISISLVVLQCSLNSVRLANTGCMPFYTEL